MDMRRRICGEWGAALSDQEFACALAALGILAGNGHHWPICDRAELSELPALLKSIEILPYRFQFRASAWTPDRYAQWLRPAEEFAAAWKEALPGACPALRVLVSLRDADAQDAFPRHDVIPWLRHVLGFPATGLKQIAFERDTTTPMSWRWPLRIGLGSDIGEFDPDSHPHWFSNLTEVGFLSRMNCECEIAVFKGTPAKALKWVRRMPYEIRASFVILFQYIGTVTASRCSDLETLCSELGAQGASLIKCTDTREMEQFVNRIPLHLSHDAAIDKALYSALYDNNRATSLLELFSDELLKRSRLQEVKKRVSSRLKTQGSSVLKLSEPESLGLPSIVTAKEAATVLEHESSFYSYLSEDGGGTDIALWRSQVLKSQDHSDKPEHRYIQAQVYALPEGMEEDRWRMRHEREIRIPPQALDFTMGIRHEVVVRVGRPQNDWLSPERPFPDETLPPGKEEYLLQVYMSEPEHIPEPLSGTLVLPKSGDSGELSFFFTPRETSKTFRGRIIIAYHNRILQTALLTGDVRPATAPKSERNTMKITIEANVRPVLQDLGDRSAYDLALAFNHDEAGVPTMTVLDKEHAQLRNIHAGLKKDIDLINGKLSEVANCGRDYVEGLKQANGVDVLRFLARQGKSLHAFLNDSLRGTPLKTTLRYKEYIQIVNLSPVTYFPIECVYDRALPRKDADLCPNWLQHGGDGSCKTSCNYKANDKKIICPLAFWGLSKVLERHTFPPDDRSDITGDAAVLAEPVGVRNILQLERSALFGASSQVDAADITMITDQVRASLSVPPAAGDLWMATGWEDWEEMYDANGPMFLLALPHLVDDGTLPELEISDDVMEILGIRDMNYVNDRGKAPLVILLGCETASPSSPKDSAVNAFRAAGAAIVLGTLAKVYARDAARAALLLTKHLYQTCTSEARPFGEILREVRLKCLADGLLVALSFCAFGDADWKIAIN